MAQAIPRNNKTSSPAETLSFLIRVHMGDNDRAAIQDFARRALARVQELLIKRLEEDICLASKIHATQCKALEELHALPDPDVDAGAFIASAAPILQAVAEVASGQRVSE